MDTHDVRNDINTLGVNFYIAPCNLRCYENRFMDATGCSAPDSGSIYEGSVRFEHGTDVVNETHCIGRPKVVCRRAG